VLSEEDDKREENNKERKARHGSLTRSIGRIGWNPVAAAKHVTKMIEDLFCLTHRNQEQLPRIVNTWKKPAPGCFKVNSDTSFVLASHTGSTGAVITDEEGNLLMAAAKFYEHIPDVLTA
jgi:hypothetical protein